MAADSLVQTLLSLASQAPGWLVWLVGGIVAIATWGKHPGVSALTMAAMGIHLLSSLVSTAFYAAVPRTAFFQNFDSQQIQYFYTGMNFVWALVHGFANVLLLFAIFKWRGRGEGSLSRAEGPGSKA